MILDSPIISGSLTQQAGQIAEIPRYTDVSSSFLAASASFDARLDSVESITASLSPRINALESFTASADNTYVNVSGDSMSGNLTITGSLIVTDRITAQEFHTEFVSSSVIFQSGSTKFGDTLDDTHSVTGSLNITGSITLNGSAIGTGKLDETTFNSYTSSNDSKVNSLVSATGSYETIGRGIISSSAQLPNGLVSGSSQLTSSYDDRYVLSGSITQTTWDNIANKPGGIVSSSAQLPSGLISGSSQLPSGLISGSSQLPAGIISGSEQLPVGTVSGSSQVILQSTTGQLSSSRIDNLSEIHNQSWTASVANDQFSIIHDGSNILTLTSGSTNITNGTLNVTADSFANDYAEGYTDFGVGLNVEGDVVVTGSITISGIINANEFHTNYITSSIIYKSGSTKFGDSVDDTHEYTGSVLVSGNIIANNLVGIISGSSQLPAGLISGSSQLTASYDERYTLSGSVSQTTWETISGKPAGIISGSSQLSGTTIQSLSGSFSGSYQGDGSLLRGLAAGAKFHTQTTPSSTWTFIHNLSTQYPNVTVYDSNNNIVLPQTITATNVDTLVLEFGSPVAGYATAGVGGIIEVNGRTVKQYFASSLEWRFEHNFGDRFANIQTYDSNYEKIIPQTITLTDATSSLITFPEVTEGWVIGTIGGDLPAISSSYGGYVLQISNSSPYTASWTPIAYVTASNSVNSISASYVEYSNISNKPTLISGSSQIIGILNPINEFTASNLTTNIFTSSATARLNALETTSASVDSLNTTQNNRLSSLELKTGSLATTGSNTFVGTQTITGSLYITTDLIVQGSSSLQNITASAVSIGTNIVNLNTANPSIRYAGLSMVDSGSIGGSGSFLYDSVQDEMIFVHRGVSTVVTSSVLLMGPQTYDSVGSENYPTLNIIQKGTGNEHLVDSCIFDNGTTTCVKNNLIGSGTACFASNVCAPTIVVNNTNPVLYINSGNNETATIGFTQGAVAGYGGFIKVGTGLGDRSMTFGLSAAGTNNDASTLVRLDDSGATCFSNTICAPSIVSCNGSAFFQRGANGCNGLVISEQGGSITADKASVIRTAGGTSEHLFLTAGINANTSACGYIRLGGDRDACVGINIVPTAALHVNGNIISEGCFFSGAPDNLRIFAGHWATVSGNSNCYLVFQAGGGSSSFGTPTGWGGSASIYTLNQTRLSISCTGVACFSSAVCAQQFIGQSSMTVNGPIYFQNGGNTYFQQYVGSSCDFVIYNTTNNGMYVYTNSVQRFAISGDGVSSFSNTLCVGNGLIVSSSKTCGDLGIVNGNGYGWIYAQDANHSIIMRGNRAGVAADYTNYYQYGGNLSTGKGHLFWTGGVLSSQTLKMQIADDGIQVSVNFAPSANNTYCLGTSSCAWAHIYTNDLHLSNMSKCGGNDIDGTNGNWTIQEGAENLYIINNRNCKRFKIKLEEII